VESLPKVSKKLLWPVENGEILKYMIAIDDWKPMPGIESARAICLIKVSLELAFTTVWSCSTISAI
jgi:hypothetical protein